MCLAGAFAGLVHEPASPAQPLQLLVSINGTPTPPLAYDGQALWIGCDETEATRLAVPVAVRSEWHEDLVDPYVAAKLLQPRALNLASLVAVLKPNDIVHLRLVYK